MIPVSDEEFKKRTKSGHISPSEFDKLYDEVEEKTPSIEGYLTDFNLTLSVTLMGLLLNHIKGDMKSPEELATLKNIPDQIIESWIRVKKDSSQKFIGSNFSDTASPELSKFIAKKCAEKEDQILGGLELGLKAAFKKMTDIL